MKTIEVDFVARIRKKREEKDWSQDRAADELGMSRRSYLGLEQRKRELKVTEAVKICEVFKMTPNELFGFAS